MILDDPLGIESVESVFRYRDVPAVEQTPLAPNAANAAPRTRADERTESVLTEVEREDIAVRSGIMIQQTDFRTADQLLRKRRWGALAVDIQTHEHTPQTLQHDLIDETAAIPALVDEQGLLVHLSIELPHELFHTETLHVRQIDI